MQGRSWTRWSVGILRNLTRRPAWLNVLFADLSFATQAMRLLMFCVRYLDMDWIQNDRPTKLSMRLFLLFSTLIVVMLLGYKKWWAHNDQHRNRF